MKVAEWTTYQKQVLIPFYEFDLGITCCENCGSSFGVSFHHLIRRSRGGENNLSNIILLCAECHHKADNAVGHVEFNKQLIQKACKRYWVDPEYFVKLNVYG